MHVCARACLGLDLSDLYPKHEIFLCEKNNGTDLYWRMSMNKQASLGEARKEGDTSV